MRSVTIFSKEAIGENDKCQVSTGSSTVGTCADDSTRCVGAAAHSPCVHSVNTPRNAAFCLHRPESQNVTNSRVTHSATCNVKQISSSRGSSQQSSVCVPFPNQAVEISGTSSLPLSGRARLCPSSSTRHDDRSAVLPDARWETLSLLQKAGAERGREEEGRSLAALSRVNSPPYRADLSRHSSGTVCDFSFYRPLGNLIRPCSRCQLTHNCGALPNSRLDDTGREGAREGWMGGPGGGREEGGWEGPWVTGLRRKR